jgi:hypothetical protein
MAEAMQAKTLTQDEARRIAADIARLVLLSGGNWGLRFPPLARGMNVQGQ